MVALESMAVNLAKTIVQKAARAWIADRRTTEVSKKELSALLKPWFRSTAPEQRILGVAASDLQSFSHEFRGLDDGERAAALLAVQSAFEREDLADQALFEVDLDAAKLASRLRAGQPGAKTEAWLGEAGGAFYDAALNRCCELYVRAVQQVPEFLGRSQAEILSRLSDLSDQVAEGFSDLPGQVAAALHEAQAEIRDQTIDYRLDIARLATATENALRSLEVSLTTIPAPGQPIALQRPAVDALVGRAHAESFLVVGDPGAGKTVALHELARRAAADHMPVLFLSVGSTAAASEGELRNELGLEHNLIDVLQHWSPGGGGLFVIDTLDAARNDPQADLWRSIIDIARDRLPEWRVVASVRTWDLQHSPRLKAQFPGQAVHLDELDEGELAQAAAAWPDLSALLRAARPDLHHLLRNPFNLRLAAELLLSGATTRELRQVNDQLELLHRYWEHRVSDRPGGLARGALLARMCNYAVRHRTLTTPVGEVLAGDVTEGETLETLLSRSVLTEVLELPSGPATGSVRFAHHVLFDYAVAATVFAMAKETLHTLLHDDPDLVLFARPSIDMHLERLWTADPRRFFEVSLAMAENSALPRLATVVTAEVAARRAVRLGDLDALLGPVMEGGASPGALRVLRYLAVAVVIDREDAEDASPGIWPTVVELRF